MDLLHTPSNKSKTFLVGHMDKRPASAFPASQRVHSNNDDFNENDQYDNYHLIKSSNRFGFIVDPGAASGLVGTDSVLEYQSAGFPYCDSCDVEPSNGKSTGIDGKPTPGLGMLRQIAQISRLKVRWNGEMIGQAGSFCPFLLPLPPLIEPRAILVHGLYSNGDGALIFAPTASTPKVKSPEACGDVHIARVLLTDSGHYLLPTDCQ